MQNDTCRVEGCDLLIYHKKNQLCAKHQARVYRHGHTDTVRPKAVKTQCCIEGCENLTRSGSADLCPKHYHRKYRHGDTDKTAVGAGVTVSLGRRYRVRYAPNHAVAGKRGMAYEHRIVLYDHIGDGPHQCYWCRRQVAWKPVGDAVGLQVDHLDGDGANNLPDNLVASCRRCNSARAVQARARALRDAGWWSKNDTVDRLGARVPDIEAARLGLTSSGAPRRKS